jgi:Spy/CpxP family protein refolding chaperone
MIKSKIFSIVVILIALIGINTTFAQVNDDVKKPKLTPEERAKMITDKMQKRLSLSESQYQSIYDIILVRITERRKEREQFQGERKAFRESQKEKNKAAKQQIKSILTDEQKAQLKEMKKQRKMEKGNKNKEGRKHKNKNKNRELR